MNAFEFINTYLEQRLNDLLRICNGSEREHLIEFSRSADLHTYYKHYFSVEELGKDLVRKSHFIPLGLSAVYKALLPLLGNYPDGIPWQPSNKNTTAWTDEILTQLGELVSLRRLVEAERYGLVKCSISSNILTIKIVGSNSEFNDIADQVWLNKSKMQDNADLYAQLSKQFKTWAMDRISDYVKTDYDWFISYNSDYELLGLYEKILQMEMGQYPEAEALPPECKLGRLTFSEWMKIASLAAARARLHIAFATSLTIKMPQLHLRNLLTIFARQEDIFNVWKEQTGLESDDDVMEIAELFMLSPTKALDYYQNNDYGLPFNIYFGRYFSLLPIYSTLENPFTYVVEQLKIKYSLDWDRAVATREAVFQRELYELFDDERYWKGPLNHPVRNSTGSLITDVDAIVYDMELNEVYLFQLKWLDVFGLNLKHRESKRKNLLHANKWIESVFHWASNQEMRVFLKTVGYSKKILEQPATFKLFVLSRYTSSFSEIGIQDDRACWISWAGFCRAVKQKKKKQKSLNYLFTKKQKNEKKRIVEKSYFFPNLEIVVTQA